MPQSTIAVFCSDPTFLARSEQLTAQLDLPLIEIETAGQYQLLLRHSRQGLELFKPNDPKLTGSVRVDFISGQAAFRRRRQKKESLLRAVGCKGNALPKIIDGTGGLGRDSFLLAAAGCQVHIFERQPIIAALLADGLERARTHPETLEIAGRIRLSVGDTVTAFRKMARCGEQVDAVYLDPMFPHRRKAALVKKELQMLQLLAPVEQDGASEELLQAALAAAGNRVVVKRPVKAPFLTDLAPSHSLAGKTVRFDVYLTVHQGVHPEHKFF